MLYRIGRQNAVSAPAAAAPPAAAAAAGEASADTTVAGVSTEVLTGAASSSGAVAEPPDAEQPGAKRMKTEGGTSAEGAAADGAMAESTDSAAVSGGGTVNSAAAAHDEDSAANLEASLQSCTAHRDRILQMLIEEPDNRNLIELRDQLTNAINQLQVCAAPEPDHMCCEKPCPPPDPRTHRAYVRARAGHEEHGAARTHWQARWPRGNSPRRYGHGTRWPSAKGTFIAQEQATALL